MLRTNKPTLVYDLIARVLELSQCANDYALLAQCASVDWEFNRAASRILYSRAVLSPPFNRVLHLKDPGAIPVTSNFASALLARNAPFVVTLEVSGYISPRPPPWNTLPETISNALLIFVNLISVRFTPVTYHENLLDQSILSLQRRLCLTELSVNASCTDDVRAPKLVQLGGLRKLTLYSPGRAILQLLPDWLERLQKTLVELHLKDNCGSITPGVLKSFLPHVDKSLNAFTLGLSYSLTNEDVFTFLGNLTSLKHVGLRYYWARISGPSAAQLLCLQSFVVRHSRITTRKEADELDKWVRRAIHGSSNLQTLRLHCEGGDDYRPVYLSHDALVDHLVMKRFGTLKDLDLSSVFVGLDKLKDLFSTCTQLESISLQAGENSLLLFATHVSSLKQLRVASFEICNVSRSYRTDEALVTNIIQKGQPSLGRLSVNSISWEASWIVTDREKNCELVVRTVERLPPPWARA